MRRDYLCYEDEIGYLGRVRAQPKADPIEGMMNLQMMTDILNDNVQMWLSSMFCYTWVTTFFQGYIIARLPFMVTQSFKAML